MLRRLLFIPLALWVVASPGLAATAHGPCPPPHWERPQLEALRANDFRIADRVKREHLAVTLVACLASPDPLLRDSIAFEALTKWLREGLLGNSARLRITRELLLRLSVRTDDGFQQPFAALVLSEVVRADRVTPFLDVELRDEIASSAARFLLEADDYRGFDEISGWRHGVAHGADLAMQIAANQSFDRVETLSRLREAIRKKIAPAGHFYVYGEPDRLMQAVIFLARRKVFDAASWAQWFSDLADPAPFVSWDDVYRSQLGLAKRHNTRAFLMAVWINARLSDNADDDVLLASAESALRNIQ